VGGGGLNDLPDVPFDNQPIWLDPWIPDTDYPVMPDLTDFCLLTDAGETQEFAVTADNKRLENKVGGIREAFIWYPCTLRAANALNKSVLNIYGGWSYEDSTSDNVLIWKYESENSWWHVDAINSTKTVLASATLSSITNYPRFATFAPATPLEVAGFRIWIDETTGYSPGTQVQTGTLSSTDTVGTLLTTTLNSYYAIQSAGGPFDITNPTGACYAGNIKDATRISGGFGHLRVDGMQLSNGSIGLYCEAVGTNYGRLYFKALAATRYRAYDYNIDAYYADNTGNTSFILYNARIAGNKLMTINNLSLQNICGTGIL
jgi:hypothetical protein